MYKKAIGSLLLVNLLFLYGTICVNGSALEMRFCEKETDIGNMRLVTMDHSMGITDTAVSDQRIVQLQTIARRTEEQGSSLENAMSEQDREMLLRIVEAEAGNQDADGRLLVANVVLNRVKSDAFPDTVQDVVLQQQDGCFQFSPAGNGRLWQVTVSEASREAVERALNGEDISEGALYFVARQYADQSSMKWFDRNLIYLFEWGDHEFFK